MTTQESEQNAFNIEEFIRRNWVLGVVLLASFLACYSIVFFWFAALVFDMGEKTGDFLEKAAWLSDSFGLANTILTFFAVAGAIVALWFQSQQLRMQWKELLVVQKDYRDSVKAMQEQASTLEKNRLHKANEIMLRLRREYWEVFNSEIAERIRRTETDAFKNPKVITSFVNRHLINYTAWKIDHDYICAFAEPESWPAHLRPKLIDNQMAQIINIFLAVAVLNHDHEWKLNDVLGDEWRKHRVFVNVCVAEIARYKNSGIAGANTHRTPLLTKIQEYDKFVLGVGTT